MHCFPVYQKLITWSSHAKSLFPITSCCWPNLEWIFVILNRWCQNDVKKCSLVAGYWTVDRENLGTRLSCFGSYSKWKPNSRNAKYTPLDSITVTRCPLWNTWSSFFKPWPKRAGLSTLPYNPGDSRFWTVFPGLMIRFWNLLYNRQSLPFLVDLTFWQ